MSTFGPRVLKNSTELPSFESVYEGVVNTTTSLIISLELSQTANLKPNEPNNQIATQTNPTTTCLYLLVRIKRGLKNTFNLYKQIEHNVSAYDYSDQVKANGYRSMLNLYEKCCSHLFASIKEFDSKRWIFKSQRLMQLKMRLVNKSFQQLDILSRLLTQVELLMYITIDLQTLTLDNDAYLFVESAQIEGTHLERSFFKLAHPDSQTVFHGKLCGFQYSHSAHNWFTTLSIVFNFYNESYINYFKKNKQVPLTPGPIVRHQLLRTVRKSRKYATDPELRSRKMAQTFMQTDIHFCKSFWQLNETPLVQFATKFSTPRVRINIVKRIPIRESLWVPSRIEPRHLIEIPCPKDAKPDQFIQIRYLSDVAPKKLIKALKKENEFGTSYTEYDKTEEIGQSKFLIIHAHGGGFIAGSSKSNQIFLKPWCKRLKVPIVSIDYSLAPEFPHPRASHECFYVYAWCLINRHALGWSGERVVCIGDSAGGSLVTNIVQQAIQYEIRIPDGLVPIYAPFLLTFSISPSRLLSVADSLLNVAVLWRCLAGYCGINEKTTAQYYKNLLNMNNMYMSEIDGDDLMPFVERARLIEYHRIMGDSAFIIHALRHHPLPHKDLMSPLLSSDVILSQFPKTTIIACNDALLDDSIQMAKKLRELKVKSELYVVDNGSPHGFLNMNTVCQETRTAFKYTLDCIEHVINELNFSSPLH